MFGNQTTIVSLNHTYFKVINNEYLCFISENPNVFMVAPHTTRHLSQRCMADVVFDLGDLKVLYPDTPKEAFRKFSSSSSSGPSAASSNGYVKHMLVTQVEG